MRNKFASNHVLCRDGVDNMAMAIMAKAIRSETFTIGCRKSKPSSI
jgi:hypothetical protein